MNYSTHLHQLGLRGITVPFKNHFNSRTVKHLYSVPSLTLDLGWDINDPVWREVCGMFWSSLYNVPTYTASRRNVPTIVDVQNLRIGRVKISEPFRKLGSSCHKIVEQLSRLKLTEVTDSQERQQERYVCQQNISWYAETYVLVGDMM